MIHYNTDTNLIGSEPKKKRKKKPVGILKDLTKMKRVDVDLEFDIIYSTDGDLVLWSDVEAIIKKYS